MSKKFAMVVLGLLVLFASQGWAGSGGPGWASRLTGAGLPPAKTHYTFCYARDPKVVYLTQVITLAPTVSAPSLAGAYANYIQTTYGASVYRMSRCIAADSNADAVAEKQRYKVMFGTTRLIEIEWAGNSSQLQNSSI